MDSVGMVDNINVAVGRAAETTTTIIQQAIMPPIDLFYLLILASFSIVFIVMICKEIMNKVKKNEEIK